VLQYFPASEDPAVLSLLVSLLKGIIGHHEVAKNVNKSNAQHAIVFEAVALALALEADVVSCAGVEPLPPPQKKPVVAQIMWADRVWQTGVLTLSTLLFACRVLAAVPKGGHANSAPCTRPSLQRWLGF
jgi:hypothetical protein